MLRNIVKDIVVRYNKKKKEHQLIIDDSLVINIVKDNAVIKQLSISNTTTVAELEKLLQK